MCIIRVVPIEVTIAILILTLLALPIGNFLLITAYVRMKEKLMLLIANRAASDLLVTVIEIPHLVTTEVTSMECSQASSARCAVSWTIYRRQFRP